MQRQLSRIIWSKCCSSNDVFVDSVVIGFKLFTDCNSHRKLHYWFTLFFLVHRIESRAQKLGITSSCVYWQDWALFCRWNWMESFVSIAVHRRICTLYQRVGEIDPRFQFHQHFYLKLLCEQIPKAKKDSQLKQFFYAFGICGHKSWL